MEEKLEKPYEGGFLSLKGEKWEIGGELELEFVDTQSDAGIDEEEAHFQIDKFTLKPKVTLAEDTTMEGEISFSPKQGKTYLAEAYIKFSNLPLYSFLKVGLDDRFIKPKKETESYPLVGTAFWRDDELGITWGGEYKPFYWVMSLSNG